MDGWQRTMTNGRTTKTASGPIPADEFPGLVTKAGGTPAQVSVRYGESLAYGEVKVTASVTLNCDQTEDTINNAGRLAFYKALELVRDGFSAVTK